MNVLAESSVSKFVDRRNSEPGSESPSRERRQFTNSHEELSPEARELALAVDHYKLAHRRRFITYEEMLSVMKSLGYRK
ncbi:MAG TPA: hypothetical protein VFE46_02460 [Pirellulales bacterium]|jgi:hypothetical protein|nr:hypothetical protein [Pirellulales bacterium]